MINDSYADGNFSRSKNMLKGFVRFFKDLFEERKVIFDLAKNDFK